MPAEPQPPAPQAVLDAARQFLSSFKKPGRVLVAISGGSDSKGLLLALHELVTRGSFSAFSIVACTVDHALRPHSALEAQAVAAFCAARDIPHTIKQWTGDKPERGLQAAAREARYRLLADAAEEAHAACIVTAHTADDQRETIFMRSRRSQGDAPGLAGMADAMLFDRRIWVMRPFLNVGRAAIRAYLASQGEGWFDDPSNSNRRFERVRVRQDLAGEPEPAPENLYGALDRVQSSGRVAHLVSRHVVAFGGLVLRIGPEIRDDMDNPDCRRAMLSLVAVVGGKTHLAGRETAARLAAFLKQGDDGRLTAGRVVVDRRRTGIYLYREARDLRDITVPNGAEVIWDGRFRVENHGTSPVSVGVDKSRDASAARLIVAGCPAAVAKRAANAAPSLLAGEQESASLQPCIGLYDTFLPRFDLMMADSIAALFGRESYPPHPVHDVLTEKTAYT